MGEQDVADQQGAFAIKRRCFFSTFRFFAVLAFARAGESLLKPPLNAVFTGKTTTKQPICKGIRKNIRYW